MAKCKEEFTDAAFDVYIRARYERTKLRMERNRRGSAILRRLRWMHRDILELRSLHMNVNAMEDSITQRMAHLFMDTCHRMKDEK